jgi:hypothetical protein
MAGRDHATKRPDSIRLRRRLARQAVLRVAGRPSHVGVPEHVWVSQNTCACEYTKIAGSNRMKSVCMTAREQREQRDKARRLLDNGQACGESTLGCLGDVPNTSRGTP